MRICNGCGHEIPDYEGCYSDNFLIYNVRRPFFSKPFWTFDRKISYRIPIRLCNSCAKTNLEVMLAYVNRSSK